MNNVDLNSGWDTLWGSIRDSVGSTFTTAIAAIGVALLIGSLFAYLWQKRRGGGVTQGTGPVLWVAILGAALCAPDVLIPVFLTILSLIINLGVGLINAIFG